MITWTMAWRNIWRNRRRTLITASSIAFAVLFAGIMQALETGSWDHMIDNVIGSYTGNVQIHKKGYWDEPSINDLMELDPAILEEIRAMPEVTHAVHRLEGGALVSTGEHTRGAMIIGVEPTAEEALSHMSQRVVSGEYLADADDGVLIGDKMAEILELTVGDTIILISQGFRGVNAAGRYPVRGLVHFPTPELNRTVVIMPLAVCRYFFGAEGRSSAVVIRLDHLGRESRVARHIESRIDTARYEVMTYKELMPELMKTKQIDTSGNYIIYSILYIIIAFGIFGTVLMMVRERQYEFGVLLAIGMHRRQLFYMIWRELLMLGVLGTAVGMAVSFAVAAYIQWRPIQLKGALAEAMEKFEFEPILPATTEASVFVTQAVIVFVICLLISVYPFRHLMRLEPVEAMRT